jgi:hypothetical protein
VRLQVTDQVTELPDGGKLVVEANQIMDAKTRQNRLVFEWSSPLSGNPNNYTKLKGVVLEKAMVPLSSRELVPHRVLALLMPMFGGLELMWNLRKAYPSWPCPVPHRGPIWWRLVMVLSGYS